MRPYRILTLSCAILVHCIAAYICRAQDAQYRIHAITYDIDGATQQFVIENMLPDLQIGTEFASMAHVDIFLADQRQLLNNIRQIQTATINVQYDRSTTPIGIDIHITITDSFNIIILPRPQFESEEGWNISVRMRDYNFFGGLQPLSIDLELLLPVADDEEDSLRLAPRFVLPFQGLGTTITWESSLAGTFELIADGEFDITFDNTLIFDINLFEIIWKLSFLQGISFTTDENEDQYALETRLGLGSTVDIIPNFGALNMLKYLFELYSSAHYRFDQPVLDDIRGIDIGYTHSVAAGRVDWIDNFRIGADIRIGNNNEYNFYTHQLDTSLFFALAGHTHTQNILAYSGRVGGIYYFPLSATDINAQEVGHFARGVRNSSIQGNVAAYLNTDIKLIGFKNRDILEAQGGLFVDAIVATDTSRPFNAQEDVRIGVGFEALGFFLRARSIYLRVSIGFDPLILIRTGDIFRNGNDEIFIGLRHFY